jgi:hypothetical protein
MNFTIFTCAIKCNDDIFFLVKAENELDLDFKRFWEKVPIIQLRKEFLLLFYVQSL